MGFCCLEGSLPGQFHWLEHVPQEEEPIPGGQQCSFPDFTLQDLQNTPPAILTKLIKPDACSCGNTTFHDLTDYYTHQVIELPEIKMDVTHFVLYKGVCSCCGKTNKGLIPKEHRTGFGPRLSALIAEMAGTQADSRSIIQTFCDSVLDFRISLGAIQKVLDRVSQAIEAPYKAIAVQVRQATVNHIDETSWHKNGALMWLWVMANKTAALLIRFDVLWRKCSQGTSSDKGNRWVERILTLRQTCRLRSLNTYPILVDAVRRYFNGQEPDLSWLTQH